MVRVPQSEEIPSRLSLRGKGLVAFGVFIAYVMVAAVIVEWQRTALAQTVTELERVHAEEDSLDRVEVSLSQAVLIVNERYHRAADARELAGVVAAARTVSAGIEPIAARSPALRPAAARLTEAVSALSAGAERERLPALSEALHQAASGMEALSIQLRERKQELSGRYRSQYDLISVVWIGLGLVGLFAFGAVLVLFFTRLAWDLKRLEERALAVVKGYRGPPLAVTRSDEIGALMRSVNRMQQELLQHEAEVELARQQYFHREKMAAVGGLAAQIAHEVNNPIAAIAGVAQEICETRDAGKCPAHGGGCQPELILQQANRVSAITRQIASFSAPAAAEPELIDLNGLIEHTCAFVRYDKRLRALQIDLQLDRQVPAVHAVGDHLTQVLMNLLLNAADAIGEAAVPGRITVRTQSCSEHVLLTVSDNGSGIEETTRQRVFEDFFTTKPQGKGSGIGLGLSRKLLRKAGGEIDLDSLPGIGTTVTVRLALAARALPA
jgi:two-component system, NtrC family, sensor kinase